jgi:hypothetical protein
MQRYRIKNFDVAGDFVCEKFTMPEPARGQVIVQNKLIGFNPVDFKIAQGTNLIFETTGNNSTTLAERMRISSSGNILINQSSVITGVSTSVEMSGIGSSTATLQASYNVYANHGSSNPTWRGYYVMHKSRGTTAGSFTSVASGDHLGTVRWVGADGTGYVIGAEINGMVDGNPGTNDMPTRLEFSTTADGASGPTERMRLQSNGVLKIGNGGSGDDGINPGYKNVAISFNDAQNRGEIQAVQQQVLVYPLILNGAGGSVGIGTYSPATSTKLMVAGGIGFGNNTDGSANLSYGGRISAKQTNVTGGAGATLIHRGLGSVGYFILVSGIHSSNRFMDLIYGTGENTPIVLASNTENTFPTRTYSISGENIFVSLTNNSAVWIITTTGLGAMES